MTDNQQSSTLTPTPLPQGEGFVLCPLPQGEGFVLCPLPQGEGFVPCPLPLAGEGSILAAPGNAPPVSSLYALQRSRSVQDHLRCGPADVSDPPGPHRGNAHPGV